MCGDAVPSIKERLLTKKQKISKCENCLNRDKSIDNPIRNNSNIQLTCLTAFYQTDVQKHTGNTREHRLKYFECKPPCWQKSIFLNSSIFLKKMAFKKTKRFLL